MQRYEGECHCGRVRFELEGPPMAAFYCHCTVCRRSIGCPYADRMVDIDDGLPKFDALPPH